MAVEVSRTDKEIQAIRDALGLSETPTQSTTNRRKQIMNRIKSIKDRFGRVALGAGGMAVALALTASTCSGQGNTSGTIQNQRAANTQLGVYNTNQPVPIFPKSQLRQNAIEIETAQAQPTPTTSFFFNYGVPDPFSSCPSIGFPISAADQITNPQQLVNNPNDNGSSVVGQIDPNGIFSGNSTQGTYVICLGDGGKPYAHYDEGPVDVVDGAASWDYTTHRQSNVTNTTGHFSVLPGSATKQQGSVAP